MLHQLTFTGKQRCFNAGDVFTFQDGLNVIVGENGTGKGTLL